MPVLARWALDHFPGFHSPPATRRSVYGNSASDLGAGAVPVPNDAQAFQGEIFVQDLDSPRSFHDQRALASRRDRLRFGSEFFDHPLDDSVDQSDESVIQTRGDAADGIGADQLLRLAKIDHGQPRRARE